MSDIRTKLLMGTTISAVSIMLVMAIGITTEQNNVSAGNVAALGLMGHFEIKVVNPDGTISYAQGDNFVNGAAKTDVARAVFFGVAAEPLLGTYDCTLLGTNIANTLPGANDILNKLGTTGLACASDPGPVPGVTCDGLGASGAPGTAEKCTIVTEHTLGTDCDPSCVLTVVAIGTGAQGDADLGSVFAFTDLDGDITANLGANATVTYIVATGGPI